MSEQAGLQIVGSISLCILLYASYLTASPLWNANGDRPLLQLLAAKLIVNTILAAILVYNSFWPSDLSPWALRIGFGVLGLLFIRFGKVLYRQTHESEPLA